MGEPSYHLRDFQRGDIPDRVQWLAQDDLRADLNMTGPITMGSTISWHDKVIGDNSRHDLTACDQNGGPVAMSGITSIHEVWNVGELYFFVSPSMRRQGIGRWTVGATIDRAFDEYQLTRVWLTVNGDNIPAQRLYESVGMVEEGRLREHAMDRGGRRMDRIVYGCLRREWR